MDIGDLLVALLSTSALHTGGHFDAAGKSNEHVPMKLNMGTLSESWPHESLSSREANKIHAAGFSTQDKVTGAGDSKAMDFATGLYKTAYAANSPKYLGSTSRGDVELMKERGGKYAKEALIASALSDFMHGMGLTKGRLQFVAPDGAPGLVYTRRF